MLVHDAGLDSGAWDELIAVLGEATAYDRPGYGNNPTPEPYEGTTVEEQAEELARVLGAAPSVVCGQGFGAIVALDFVIRHSHRAAGAVLIEPPLYSLSATGPDTVAAIRQAIEEGARENGAAGAVDALLGDTAPIGPQRLERAHASVRPALIDLAAGPAWDFTRRGLAAVGVPVRVVRGERSPDALREAAGALAEMLGAAELREAASGHHAAIENPETVAAAIRELL